MSFTGPSSSTSTGPQGTLGDVPPVTFPGVASGINYNAIILKYTQATQAAEVPFQNRLNALTAANTEIIKIQNLLIAVQSSLTALSTLGTFQGYKATPSAPGLATTSQITGQNAVPGTYRIVSQTAATSTSVTNNSAANATLTPAALTGSPLNAIGASIGPSNGKTPSGQPAPNGTLTINGVKLNYDVSVDSLQGIVDRINLAGAGATASYDAATGAVTLQATTPAGLALGSASDAGNLLSVLHVDTGQNITPAAGTLVGATGAGAASITVSSTAGYLAGEWLRLDAGQPTEEDVQIAAVAGNVVTLVKPTVQNHANASAVTPDEYVTGSSPVVGINQFSDLGSTGNAGFATPVTSGTFTINGVRFTVNAANQNVNDLIVAINGSAAGVTASFNPGSDHIILTNNVPGNQNIALGSGADTSNFLSASGLIGGAITVGTQATLTYQAPTGAQSTVYSATNDFTSVIPGIKLKLTSSTATPYTIDVATDPTVAEKAIDTFVKAYNAAIGELNSATTLPAVATGRNSSGQQVALQASSGGPLYRNFEIADLRNRLVGLVSGFIPGGSRSYNSLQSIGLKLDTSSTSAGTIDTTASGTAATKADTNPTQNLTTTSGKLQALDTTTFEAALAANPSAVQSLFTSAVGGLAASLGSQLTFATGTPTILAHGLASSVPAHSLLDTVESANAHQISSFQQQIDLIERGAVAQANRLRRQFSASETQIAALQALQTQIAAIGH